MERVCHATRLPVRGRTHEASFNAQIKIDRLGVRPLAAGANPCGVALRWPGQNLDADFLHSGIAMT